MRILETFAKGLLALAAAAALTMTALVVLASAMRYLVGAPFRFTEELVALLYAAMLFLTIPLCTIRNQHIGMSLGVEMAGARLRRVLRLLACLISLVFSLWFAFESARFALFSREIGARSEQVDLLLWPWMALMPSIMLLVALIVAIQAVQAWLAIRRGNDAGQASAGAAGDPL